jgi:hypothetical protein
MEIETLDGFLNDIEITPNGMFTFFSDNMEVTDITKDFSQKSTNGTLEQKEEETFLLQTDTEISPFDFKNFFNFSIPEQPQKLEVFVKSAKCREDQYESSFQEVLFTIPYKYDLKIKGLNEIPTVSIVIAETNETPKLKSNKKGVIVENVEVLSKREMIIRLGFDTCSFHVGKKSFKLLLQNTKGEVIYESLPFQTFARRGNQEIKKRKRENLTFEKTENMQSSSDLEVMDFFQINKKISLL